MSRLLRLGIVSLTTAASVAAFATPASAASVGTIKVFDGSKVKFQAGSGKTNKVTITRSGLTVTIDDRVKIKAGTGCKAVKGDTTKVRCTVADLAAARVILDLSDGNDTLTNRSDLAITANGGRGRDSLTGGSAAEALLGGAGVDRIYGGAGNDHLNGTTENDYIRGGAGDDEVVGGFGNDELRGGPGNDRISGGRGDDVAYGNTGNDSINGRIGNDKLYGGSGNDVVQGDAHNDRVYGNTGNDRIFGGYGVDKVFGGDGNDLVNGSLEAVGSTLYDTVADQLDGGNQTDTCESVKANDSVYACEIVTNVG
ncbi:calcium-binding protein [Actinoplanes sp. NPDC024001]|uniref:calcium-binding protein n=1 Tax=Actinoplanes sp. NPDC024001 TaxID=3154598 RepID=UPI0033D03AC8